MFNVRSLKTKVCGKSLIIDLFVYTRYQYNFILCLINFHEYQFKTVPISEKILVPINGATSSMEPDSTELSQIN